MSNVYNSEKLSVQDTIEFLMQHINWDRIPWCKDEALHRALCTKYFNDIIAIAFPEYSNYARWYQLIILRDAINFAEENMNDLRCGYDLDDAIITMRKRVHSDLKDNIETMTIMEIAERLYDYIYEYSKENNLNLTTDEIRCIRKEYLHHPDISRDEVGWFVQKYLEDKQNNKIKNADRYGLV